MWRHSWASRLNGDVFDFYDLGDTRITAIKIILKIMVQTKSAAYGLNGDSFDFYDLGDTRITAIKIILKIMVQTKSPAGVPVPATFSRRPPTAATEARRYLFKILGKLCKILPPPT